MEKGNGKKTVREAGIMLDDMRMIILMRGMCRKNDVFTNYPHEGAWDGSLQVCQSASQDTCPPLPMTMDSLVESLK